LGEVVTVRGPISSDQLGLTLTHEHLFLHLENWFVRPLNPAEEAYSREPVSLKSLHRVRYRPYSNWDNIHITDFNTVLDEVRAFKAAGGGTIVELTLPAIGRDPVKMRDLASQADLNIVCGCGYYVRTSHPPSLDRKTVEEVATELVTELTEGYEGTGIRPGVIGEVGTSWPIDPVEEKVLRASALAQQRTGAPISIHLSGPEKHAGVVLDILEDAGAVLSKVALSHLDIHPIDTKTHGQLAARGAYVEYDLFGLTEFSEDGHWLPTPSDLTRIDAIKKLCEAGHGSKVLIAHDVCLKMQQIAYGGFGFAHIPAHVTPLMKAMGMSSEQINTIVRDNPAAWLTWMN
jgi:phosphotriesterase-related protein